MRTNKGRDLSQKLNYIGMERAARKLALDDKMATPEEIAIMSELEVCDLIMEKYEIIASESEKLLLIPRDEMEEFEKMAVYLSR